MTDSLFTRVGRALYGEGFIPSLARALDVNERTVQRWVSGRAYPPHGVWDELGRLLAKRNHALGLEIKGQRNMTKFAVTYSHAHQENREIGQFDTMAEAEAAARKVGAIGEPQIGSGERVYDVSGHEGDDEFGIWITAVKGQQDG